jgi:2',3'-cyclic-nucleotide 2'-phosphodiesterase (5'-nucleotidase family)
MVSLSTLVRPTVVRFVAILVAAVLLATSLTLGWQAALANAKPPASRAPVTIQFLNVSDWHGQVDPLSVTGVGNVGGAAVLSTYWQQERQAYPTLTLTGGDDFGATPPISNFFDEVPAVLAQRMMGIQVNTFGNHNFDRGIDHLQEMIDIAGAATSAEAPGAPFQYVSANLKNRDENLDDVEDFAIIDVGGIRVGVVGVTNPEAPELVFPGSFGTIEPLSPYAAANRARAAAKRAGAQVVVAVIHAGLRGFDPTTGEPFGELIDFANNVGGFDVIFGDHTDIEYSGIINDQVVVENRSKGRTYARTLLTVDPGNGRVLDRSVAFVTPLSNAVVPDPAIEAMLAPYRAQLAPIFGTQVGTSSRFVPRGDQCGRADGRLCESLVGNIVTDAMRLTYGTDFAITNSGGLRADLTCPTLDSATDFCPSYVPPPYPITRGQVNTVLPFGNQAATVTINGAELKAMLENGVSAMPGANGKFAQVSGLCFTYDIGAAVGSRVKSVVRQDIDGSCDGADVDLSAAATYTIVTNDFVASGGDGYPNVASRMVTQDILDNVVAAWIGANSPLQPAIQGRIVCEGASCPAITAP